MRIKKMLTKFATPFLLFVVGLVFPFAAHSGTFKTGLTKPTGIAIHPNERLLYVKSGASGTVWKVPIKNDGTGGAVGVVTDQFGPALDIDFDASGNLYGLMNRGEVPLLVRLDASGSICNSYLAMNDPVATGIAIEAPGLSDSPIFLQETYVWHRIFSTTPTSIAGCDDTWHRTPVSSIGSSWGPVRFLIYRSTRGDLVGSENFSVNSINKTTGACTPLIGDLVQPNGLAEDLQGNLYVADTGAGKIIKRTILGKIVEIAKGLNAPTGIAYDSETGLLFVAETNSNKITTLPVGIASSGKIGLKIKSASGQWSTTVTVPKGISPNTPAVCEDGTGKLYVFISKLDDSIVMNRRAPTGQWGTWAKVPGTVKTASAPTATYSDGKILLYARGLDDKVWECNYTVSTQKWSAWKAVPGITTPDSPEAVADATGRVFLFIREMR
jgi:sugar lactone lactonase YvrE